MQDGRRGDTESAVPPGQPVVTLRDATIRRGGHLLLAHTDWCLRAGEHWAVLGPNGAGKSSLVLAMAGRLPVVRGKRVYADGRHAPPRVGYVSFELERELMMREARAAVARDFSRRAATAATTTDLLAGSHPRGTAKRCEMKRVAALLDITAILQRPVAALSSGEMRKVSLARALMADPALLILDEPFEGLDGSSRRSFGSALDDLMQSRVQLLLVTHRITALPAGITHVICLDNSRVVRQGPRQDILRQIRCGESPRHTPSRPPLPWRTASGAAPADVLIDIREATVRYGSLTVLDRLSWTVRRGQNWAVVGPNGVGKTTLLRLIAADHPQAYANRIYLFGRRRGSGDTIWDVKQRIGLISSDVQVRYHGAVCARDVILSGFFDSVGLYRNSRSDQKQAAEQWLAWLGLEAKADLAFACLSQGEQRLVLIARCMVKAPPLLILDEPCAGLDPVNRARVLALIDDIGRESATQLLYVTHHSDDMPTCLTHVLRLYPAPQRRYAVETLIRPFPSAASGGG